MRFPVDDAILALLYEAAKERYRELEIEKMYAEELDRQSTTLDRVRPLPILEVRGEELRWESERFDTEAANEDDAWADGLLAYAAGLNRLAPRECLFWNDWLDGWDYGHHQQRDRT